MEAFCGAHPVFFFESGQINNPREAVVYPDRMYRHPQIEGLLGNADRIRFSIYNLDRTAVVAYVEFEPQPGDGLIGWWDGDRVVASSWWDVNTDTYDHVFRLANSYFVSFKILTAAIPSCSKIAGWFFVSAFNPFSSAVVCLNFQKWWTYPQVEDMGVRYQQPAFFYTATSAPVLFENGPFELGGAITIETVKYPSSLP